MKFAKVLPAMAALVVLSACASDAPKMENKAEQMATPVSYTHLTLPTNREV